MANCKPGELNEKDMKAEGLEKPKATKAPVMKKPRVETKKMPGMKSMK